MAMASMGAPLHGVASRRVGVARHEEVAEGVGELVIPQQGAVGQPSRQALTRGSGSPGFPQRPC